MLGAIRAWTGYYLDSSGVEHRCVIVQVGDATEDVIDALTGDLVAPPVEYVKEAETDDLPDNL